MENSSLTLMLTVAILINLFVLMLPDERIPVMLPRLRRSKNTSAKLIHHFDEYSSRVKNKNYAEINNTTNISDNTVFNIPPFIGIPDSRFRSPYHRYWETNCSLLFQQDASMIGLTTKLLSDSRVSDGGGVPVPSDEDFTRYTNNCSVFRTTRNYPTKPLSIEEADYPLAYIITVHTQVAQVERLLRAIYQPQNIYCVHPDAKSPPAFQVAIRSLVSCFPNIFIASKVEKVDYGGFTRVLADINCMKDLLEEPVQWTYVMNLCGQDFPLKTNLEIVRQLKAGGNHNFIECVYPRRNKKRRTMYHHVPGLPRPHRTRKRKAPPPYNFTIWAGNTYYAVTPGFVEYVLNDVEANALLEWSRDTLSPDEHYWATLQAHQDVPGGFPDAPLLGRNFRYVVWENTITAKFCVGMFVRTICVFNMGSLKFLLSQPRTFANKFYYDYDPVTLQCLEEMLDYRQRYPESIHSFVEEFPVTKLNWSKDLALYSPG